MHLFVFSALKLSGAGFYCLLSLLLVSGGWEPVARELDWFKYIGQRADLKSQDKGV
jgi:hypothetical protein